MFAQDPERTLARIDEEYVDSGQWRNDFPGVKFLAASRLNQELYGYLLNSGFPESTIRFILEMPRKASRPLRAWHGRKPW